MNEPISALLFGDRIKAFDVAWTGVALAIALVLFLRELKR